MDIILQPDLYADDKGGTIEGALELGYTSWLNSTEFLPNPPTDSLLT